MHSRREECHAQRDEVNGLVTLGVSLLLRGVNYCTLTLRYARLAVIIDTMTSNVMQPESLTEAVARRLRGQLAERRLTQKRFQELTGWGRMYVYRRLTGEMAFDTSELEHIESTTGILVNRLMADPDTGTMNRSVPPVHLPSAA